YRPLAEYVGELRELIKPQADGSLNTAELERLVTELHEATWAECGEDVKLVKFFTYIYGTLLKTIAHNPALEKRTFALNVINNVVSNSAYMNDVLR
ncbi:MAG TPA: hypothetical protein VJJ83_02975, partial [Candidatus Babeliales bacterium]|nr:hypothetical protein [Candidatus Babeliales bacterium]